MLRTALAMLLLAAALASPPAPAGAETCTRETLRQVVDTAGARLRVLTSETQPRVQARIRQLKDKRGWTGPDADDRAAALMSDANTAELDAKAAGLLQRIDALSELSDAATPDCSHLGELEAASLELQATVRAKSAAVIARLDRELEGAAPASPAASAAVIAPTPAPPVGASLPAGPPVAQPPVVAAPSPPPVAATLPKAAAVPAAPKKPTPPKEARAAPPPPPAQPPAAAHTTTGWTTATIDRTTPALPPASPPPASVVAPAPPPMPHLEAAGNGFSRDEIQAASTGFFGTLSSGLANIFEHAFSTLGKPNAYVLGNESGGAIIAGVRYGRGTLFTHDGGHREVFWHGPSIGYDLGASGSKTMFLVYNLKEPLDVFSGFSGVDGSAYLVGGFGMTLLTDGKVVMAPIRSGVGLRLGANIGYVRFTARPTWNPF